MANKFDEMRAAVADAGETLKAADAVAEKMAQLLVGRLRRCSGSDLAQIKRELRNFNMRTWQWRNR